MRLPLLILSTICTVCYSQDTVKIYLDNNFNVADKTKAVYEREAIINKGYYKISDKDLEGRMINSVEYSSINPWIEHGQAIHYYAPNRLYSKGNYYNGKILGKWIYYDGIAPDTVYYLPLEQYFSFNKCPGSNYYSENKDTKLVGELVLDSLSNLLSENFHMPARTKGNIKEFTQYINFIIDKDGNVKCPEIANKIHPDIDSEIFRILQQFKYKTAHKKAVNFTLAFPYNENGDQNDNVYLVAEQMPVFQYAKCNKNDLSCFKQYIIDSVNILTPGCLGNIIIGFIVEKDGTVKEISIDNDIENCKEYIAEIERVIKSCPNWNPGIIRGVPVRVKITLPISLDH